MEPNLTDMTDETEAVAIAAPEWMWKLAEAIVLGNQGLGNAAVMIERAFEAQLARARQEGWNAAIEAAAAHLERDDGYGD